MAESNTFSFDMGGIAPMLNAMMNRYGQYMDMGLQEAAAEAPRRKRGFQLWEAGKKSELEDQRLARKSAKEQKSEARRLEMKSDLEKKRKEAMAAAEKNRAFQAVNWSRPQSRNFIGNDYNVLTGGQRMDPTTAQLMRSIATGTLQG